MKIRKWLPVITLVLLLLTACGSSSNAVDSNNDSEQTAGGNTGGDTGGDTGQPPVPTGSATAVVLAANDLGMHCIDREFSVFSILPPFNVVHAQVLNRNTSGLPELLDATRVDVRYDGIADANGSVNSYSATGPLTKTDFWDWANTLFGTNLTNGEGLAGLYMPGDDPANRGAQPMAYDATEQWFTAEGIPITPVDDNGQTNPFGLMRISAQDSGGQQIGYEDVVVPVAAETDCQACHKTGGIAAQGSGWSNAQDLEVQSKINILRLHDLQVHTSLEASQPVLCASCHYSLALDLAGTGPTAGQAGQPAFSKAIHSYHSGLKDGQGQPIFTADINGNCYQCHPGKTTQCLRGAMAAGGVDCFDCHGDLASVGGAYPLLAGGSIDGANDGNPRRPWLDLPRCQSCHTGDAVSYLNTGTGLMRDATWPFRLVQAYATGDLSASPVAAPNSRFAENSHMLYRFSKGHAGVFCEGCHGSTHAVWPNSDLNANDNVAAIQLQGHTGKIIECTTCHANALPNSLDGPHGLHPVGATSFANGGHEHLAEQNRDACRACHGANGEGTVLSKAAADRSLSAEGRQVNLTKGQMVSCNLCHGNPL